MANELLIPKFLITSEALHMRLCLFAFYLPSSPIWAPSVILGVCPVFYKILLRLMTTHGLC